MAKSAQQQLFEGIGGVSAGVERVSRPVSKGLFSGLRGGDDSHTLDWATDADWARLQEEPLRARSILLMVILVFIALTMWAGIAEVDEVTRGEGRVIPSRQLQVIQSVDGGVVSEIHVVEGQIVEAGELLLRVDPTRFVSSLRENQAQFLTLQARAARLTALTQGTDFIVPDEVIRDAPELVAHEQRLYLSNKAEVAAQLQIASEQVAQRRQELNEASSRRAEAVSAMGLIAKELEVTRPLLRSGAVSEVEILRLERDLGRYRGERDQAGAQIARIQAAIAEAQQKIQEVELNSRNIWRAELSETLGRLAALTETSTALEDRVRHADVRSPVRGTVSRVLVNTVGGVVQPGREVVEIVPLDDALILEARILPKDIAFLRPGQEAVIKFSAYDFAIFGGLDAVLEHISADTVTDDKGNAYYVVRLRTLESSLGDDLPIIPGMVATVDILTGKKTILSYLLKPVLRAKANALSER